MIAYDKEICQDLLKLRNGKTELRNLRARNLAVAKRDNFCKYIFYNRVRNILA